MRTTESKHPENAGCNHAVTRDFNEAAVCATALGTKKLHRTSSPKPCHVERSRSECERRSRNIPRMLIAPMPRQGVLPGARVLSLPAVRDGSIYKFWVYVLSSNSGTLYIGVTGYLARRVHQHKIDSIEGFTEKYQIHRLVYYEAFDHIVKAISREKQLKGWRRQKKMALVETTNPRWRDLAQQWGREMRLLGQSLGRTP
jgi:putative endonuclease